MIKTILAFIRRRKWSRNKEEVIVLFLWSSTYRKRKYSLSDEEEKHAKDNASKTGKEKQSKEKHNSSKKTSKPSLKKDKEKKLKPIDTSIQYNEENSKIMEKLIKYDLLVDKLGLTSDLFPDSISFIAHKPIVGENRMTIAIEVKDTQLINYKE